MKNLENDRKRFEIFKNKFLAGKKHGFYYVQKVSSSGLSAKIKLFVIEDNAIMELNAPTFLAKELSFKDDDSSYYVKGCNFNRPTFVVEQIAQVLDMDGKNVLLFRLM